MDRTTAALEVATAVVALALTVTRLVTETVDWWSGRERATAVSGTTPDPDRVGDAGTGIPGARRGAGWEDDGA